MRTSKMAGRTRWKCELFLLLHYDKSSLKRRKITKCTHWHTIAQRKGWPLEVICYGYAAMKVIRAHDQRWKDHFKDEARALRACLGETVLEIHHIGSTAVPGIMAKPVIDILVEMRSLDAVDARVSAMEEIGYESRGEYGIPGRRYFTKSAEEPVTGVHVHVFASGSEEIARHIRFRDFLLARPEIAQQYSALKQSLANGSGVLPDDYAVGKAAFIRRVVRLAELPSKLHPMTPDFTIRIANDDDFSALAILRWRLKTGDDARLEGEEFSWFTEEFLRFERLVRTQGEIVHWVADIAGTLAASMSVVVVRKVTSPNSGGGQWAYLTNCYVVPEQRNAGVGRRLLEAIQTWASVQGFEFVIVWPSDRAFPFYERSGFQRPDDLLIWNPGTIE